MCFSLSPSPTLCPPRADWPIDNGQHCGDIFETPTTYKRANVTAFQIYSPARVVLPLRMRRIKDVYADAAHPHCKFAGTELLDRQGYYAALVVILQQKLADDGVLHRREIEFSERYEIEARLAQHLARFEHNLRPSTVDSLEDLL